MWTHRGMLVFALLTTASFAGEITLVIQAGGRPVGAGVSVWCRTPLDRWGGETREAGSVVMKGVEAGREVTLGVEYGGKKYSLDTTFKEDSGWYDVLLSSEGGRPSLTLRKRKGPAEPSPAIVEQEPEPKAEQAVLLSPNWRARLMQAGNAAIAENWKSQLEIETMTLGKAKQEAILQFAQSLRGADGYKTFLAMNDEQRNACITHPTLRAIARPFAEAKTELVFDLCMTTEDWDKIKAVEAKDKLLYRQQFGLTATAKDEAAWLETAKGLSGPDWRDYRQKLTGTAANTVHSNPILRHIFFRYVDAKPEAIEAHQATLRQKEEEARRLTPAWQAAEAERQRKEAEAREREQREKAAWGKFSLANSYAKAENRSLALLTLKEVIKLFPETAACKAAVPLLAKWEKGQWLIQESDVERPASPEETPAVAESEPDAQDDGLGKGIDVERRLQMIALVEEVEERLADLNAEKWNAILKAKTEEQTELRDAFRDAWEVYEGKKKLRTLTDQERKDFANYRAWFSRECDALDQTIYDANKAKKTGYANIHNEALKLIRKIKAGKCESLTKEEVIAILKPGK